MIGYLGLLVLFTLFFAVCFYFGVREWRFPQDDAPIPVEVEYLRVENYFGTSFRLKMRDWLVTAKRLPPAEPEIGGVRQTLEKSNGERILVVEGGCWPSSRELDDLLYCEQDLCISEHSVLQRELYALGSVHTGVGVKLQSLAADGGIVLGGGNEVARWVDSNRAVLLQGGTVVGSRVSSQESIELEPSVSAQSLYAPLIFTAGFDVSRGILTETSTGPERQPLDCARAGKPRLNLDAELGAGGGISLSLIEPDTWLVRGDLELSPGTCVDKNLIVQGSLRSGGNCCFHFSVKARCIELGPDNRIAGSLVSDSMLSTGIGTVVEQHVVAEKDIALGAGSRVGSKGRLAAVSAGRDVIMETNVAVCGKVAAGRMVMTQ